MSARVCLILTMVWLVLAAPVAAQVGRGADRGPAGSPPPPLSGATTRPASAVPAGELISNAPRSLSSAEGAANQVRRETPNRSASRAVNDDSNQLAPMPLPPRSDRQRRQATSSAKASSGRGLLTVLSSLAIVLVVFFAFVWVTRSSAPKGMAPLSKEVVESLGRAPLLGRQQMQLIRVGNKLILLSVTSSGADTLTEITDPVEVDRLAGLCRQAQSGSISDSFRQVLSQATAEPAAASPSQPRQAYRTGNREPHRA